MKGNIVSTSGSLGRSPKVTIYTTPHCHWCRVAKRHFSENAIRFTEIDVSRSGPGRREMILMTGSMAVPVIRVGEHAMSGWDEAEFRMLVSGRFKQR